MQTSYGISSPLSFVGSRGGAHAANPQYHRAAPGPDDEEPLALRPEDAPEAAVSEPQKLQIKIPDDVLGGVYANQMVVSHTREEFLLDFINLFPPGGVVNARVIVSPGHMKRMIRALSENLSRYEASYGAVLEAEAPRDGVFRN